MIIEMCKYLIYGKKGDMERFFSSAQSAGCVEFIGMSHRRPLGFPETAKKLLAAIKIAKHHSVDPNEGPQLDAERIAEKILFLQSEQKAFSEELKSLSDEIARISPLGRFSLDDLHQLERDGKRVIQFFCMKSSQARITSLPSEVLYVGTEYDLDYFVAIHRSRTQYPKMIEIIVDRSLDLLYERRAAVRGELMLAEASLRFHCNSFSILRSGLNDCLNEYTLRLAKHDASVHMDDTLFAIEAWVPKSEVQTLHRLVDALDVECEQTAIEASDRIPTRLENKGVLQLGEDLIQLYDTPAHTDLDPSSWVLFFFTLFFAMILSDAGYGILFLLSALWIQWKMRAVSSGIVKRCLRLLGLLSLSSIVWGVAVASFFGMDLGPTNPLRKASLIHYLAVRKAEYHLKERDDVYASYAKQFPSIGTATGGQDFLLQTAYQKDGKTYYLGQEKFYDNILLEGSLVIGILHLSLSFLRWGIRNPTGFGWILFMFGGYFYFPVYLDATSMANFLQIVPKWLAREIGLQLLYIGPLLVLLAAFRQKKGWFSLLELTHGIQVFSDVLSYLRLYALALASMVMASTINSTLGIDAGIVGSFLIIFVGHSINISLSSMSAVIHGLRLNFLEWYRYSFEGGGRPFNPLRLRVDRT